MYTIFDGLNGSRISREYVEKGLTHGLSVIHVTVNNFSAVRPYPTLAEALGDLARIRAHFRSLEDVAHLILEAADFDRAGRAGKLGVIFGYQNVPGIGDDLQTLEAFADLGVRCVQISHNRRGPYAGGCADAVDEGISSLGRELISELNRLRICVDLSHTGERSTLEAITLSEAPACVTHANSYVICPNARNKSDAVLDALKRKGGVIGLCYLTPLVKMGSEPPTAEEFKMHIDHVRERIGAEYIGIGSDFIEDQPAERYEEFLRNPQVYGTWPWRFPIKGLFEQQRFLRDLEKSGYSTSDIQGIAGENFIRVFKTIFGRGRAE
jgi:membrane dipeptidase